MRSTKKPTINKKIPLLLIAGVLILALVVWVGVSSYRSFVVNYAAEVVAPLESALVKAGGVKKCSYGDGGRGSDNQRPWYQSYYELPLNREKAIATVNDIAHKNGYSLTHANPENRGHLGAIADLYIDNWYFDNSSKQNPYSDLQSGSIKLAFGVNNDGVHELSEISCGTDQPVEINSGDNRSMISIDVSLPEYKR